MKLLYTTAVFFFLCLAQTPAQIVLKDIFNRNLSQQTIMLTDWEGYMANPAIRLTITAPAGATFPLKVKLRANNALLYFDIPSTTSATGPAKTITLKNNNPVSFYISNFPDRDSLSEQYTLTLSTSKYGTQTYAVKVTDQDLPSNVSPFKVIIDFSEDSVYNVFNSAARKDAVTTAANDWAYFITNKNFDAVAAGAQRVSIWGDDYERQFHFAFNPKKFKGFYLYAFGVKIDPNISGGSASWDNFQTINGVATGLRSGGGYNADPRGNFNNLGWSTSYTDSTWFLATNYPESITDLYSVAHHEIGHCLVFNGGYTVFQTYEQQGYINDPELLNYTRQKVYVDGNDHLLDSTGGNLPDRISKKGIFGSENAYVIPYGRSIITKTDLIVMKLIGYDIKNTPAFSTPAFTTTTTLPTAITGSAYNAPILVTGGIQSYNFTLASSTLPPGLNLNAFTGTISGIPTQSGTYSFKIQLMDYDSVTAVKKFTITVGAALQNSKVPVSSLTMYPNPTHNYVQVRCKDFVELIIENNNQEILQIKTIVNSGTIDLSKYKDGVYYIIEKQTSIIHKIIKE